MRYECIERFRDIASHGSQKKEECPNNTETKKIY